MDQLEVESLIGEGTIVRMRKRLGVQLYKEHTQQTGQNAV